jgi:hypothetical protein
MVVHRQLKLSARAPAEGDEMTAPHPAGLHWTRREEGKKGRSDVLAGTIAIHSGSPLGEDPAFAAHQMIADFRRARKAQPEG